MNGERLDLDDPALWGTIYHGSASEIEMAALALVAELRASRERVATLEGERDQANRALDVIEEIVTAAERGASEPELRAILLDASHDQEGNHE